jgi:hypothetical protein
MIRRPIFSRITTQCLIQEKQQQKQARDVGVFLLGAAAAGRAPSPPRRNDKAGGRMKASKSMQ